MAIVAAFFFIGFSLRIIAKFLEKSANMFRNPVNSYLVLLTVFSPFLYTFFYYIASELTWRIDHWFEIIVRGVLACQAPLALSLLILTKKDENSSRSFLVIPNILPAFITLLYGILIETENSEED